MTTHHYSITIDSLRHIPGDVLVEHLGYHLRAFADENGKAPHISLDAYATSPTEKVEYREARNHPFEGPELFDDDFFEDGPVKEGTELQMGIEKLLSDDDRKDVYVDGGPYAGVKYVDVSNVTDKDRTFVPTQKDPLYDGFVPIKLTKEDEEALNRAIATDFPHLSALFNHKRGQA